MTVNNSKSKVVHYRPVSIPRTNYAIHDHLDWNVTAKVVAQSANRALGLLIAKSKSLGGMPYSVFTKLCDSTVWSVVAYGASIWGTRQFSCIDCIDAVQFKAHRYFLGTGKYTAIYAVAGDRGWIPSINVYVISGHALQTCLRIG